MWPRIANIVRMLTLEAGSTCRQTIGELDDSSGRIYALSEHAIAYDCLAVADCITGPR